MPNQVLFDLYHKGNFGSKVVPLVNSSVGVSRVSVAGISFEEGSGVAHFYRIRSQRCLRLCIWDTLSPLFPCPVWQKN